MHSKDVLEMIESFAKNAGPELKHELDITAADMHSGNNEIAITRLEARVGSPLMSDVCRGLISINRGDVNTVYWKSLSMKFADIQRQQLRLEAEKIPKKVKKGFITPNTPKKGVDSNGHIGLCSSYNISVCIKYYCYCFS